MCETNCTRSGARSTDMILAWKKQAEPRNKCSTRRQGRFALTAERKDTWWTPVGSKEAEKKVKVQNRGKEKVEAESSFPSRNGSVTTVTRRGTSRRTALRKTRTRRRSTTPSVSSAWRSWKRTNQWIPICRNWFDELRGS